MEAARRSLHRQVIGSGVAPRTGALAAAAAFALVSLCSCDTAPKPRAAEPATSASPPALAATPAVSDPHADHDCAQAHPGQPRPPAPTATALSVDARARVTTLRISAHRGSVILRKGAEGWTTGGPQGCSVAATRIQQALDNLSALTAVSSTERPASSAEFELQIVALMGQERALHFDVAGRSDGTDLIQLTDASTFRLRGLDRDLWSPTRSAWCAPDN